VLSVLLLLQAANPMIWWQFAEVNSGLVDPTGAGQTVDDPVDAGRRLIWNGACVV
jgi:hypothetical protein